MSGPAPSSKDVGRPKRERARQAASTADEAAVLDLLHRQVPSSVPVRGPMVSMIMLNRDGEGLLRRCLPALARTAYSDLELIVIDNASSDSSLAVLDAYAPPFPVSIVRSGTNTTFSEGNNLGLRACHGDGVLLINNDIEPIDPTWLGAMVQTMSDPTVAAVGARLVYPRDALGSGRWVHPPLSLQHGGVMFRMTEGIPMPVPAGAGGNPVSQWAAETRESPALTAACLLLRRTDLEELGGLPAGYDYGLEDIDLCLQLRARGRRLVYDGRAALWHHESATRGGGDVEARRARVLANRTLFASRWGPRIYRTVMTSALGGDTTWLVAPISVRITGATSSPMARDTSAAVASLGWSITGLDAEPDVELLLEPLEPAPAPSADPIRIAVGEGKARSAAVDPWSMGRSSGRATLQPISPLL